MVGEGLRIPPSCGMVDSSGVMDDLGRGRRSRSLRDHGQMTMVKKNIFEGKKMKKEIYYKQHWTSVAFKRFSKADFSLVMGEVLILFSGIDIS